MSYTRFLEEERKARSTKMFESLTIQYSKTAKQQLSRN